MGWSASWVAVQGAPKAEILRHLGLRETGEDVFPGSGVGIWSSHDRGDGWVILFCEYFDGADEAMVLDLSRFGLAVGCQFEDKVDMTSIALAARDGRELWRVFHINDRPLHLKVRGDAPAGFEDLRATAMAKQQAKADADYLHDVPLDTAALVVGYRNDEYEPAFGALESTAEPELDKAPRRGFWSRLFGGG